MTTKTAPVETDRVFQITLDVFLRIALIVGLLVFSYGIVEPFVTLLLWAAVLAAALSAPFEWLAARLGSRRGPTAAVFAVGALGFTAGVGYLLGGSLLASVDRMRAAVDAGALELPPPPVWVERIPRIGASMQDAWLLASENSREAAERYAPQIEAAMEWAIHFLTGVGGAVLTTLVSLVIAMVMLTHRDAAATMLRRLLDRVTGTWDEDVVGIAHATVTSVAVGVLGVATIQALVAGAGMYVAGFPLAGVWTIVMLVLAIAQFPGLIPMAVPLVWGFGNLDTAGAVVFAVFCVVAGLIDAPLKAVLLGRGLPIPSSVILIGAIGGMVSMGIIGLFLGAVGLAIAYILFQSWLLGTTPDVDPGPEPEAAAA